MKADISQRRAMQPRTVDAIVAEAAKRGAHAAPVVNRKGFFDEVHLFRDGQLRASIFRPADSRLGVWRGDADQVLCANVSEAVQRGLDPLRKSKHKGSSTHGNPPVLTPSDFAGRRLEGTPA